MGSTAAFARFTLTEYLRSWRFLAELLALVIVVWVFFWPRGASGPGATQFFTIGGLVLLAQTAYTTAVVMGMGRRPQGYVVLVRQLGRIGYLGGLYLASIVVTLAFHLSLSVAVALLHTVRGSGAGFSLVEWLLGTLPLLLDAAIVSAFVALIAPLVTTGWQRLLALTLLLLALAPDLPALGELGWQRLPAMAHQLLAVTLIPVLGGLQLAAQREYSDTSPWLLLSQLLLLSTLLALALLLFRRREIVLV